MVVSALWIQDFKKLDSLKTDPHSNFHYTLQHGSHLHRHTHNLAKNKSNTWFSLSYSAKTKPIVKRQQECNRCRGGEEDWGGVTVPGEPWGGGWHDSSHAAHSVCTSSCKAQCWRDVGSQKVDSYDLAEKLSKIPDKQLKYLVRQECFRGKKLLRFLWLMKGYHRNCWLEQESVIF